ncbi:MAG: Stk1 family PASTA domain-containing Ser/Thr kinase [Candidatus Nanopelagicales bacterium]
MSDVRRLGDRYQVGDLLGRGGMAEVHEGRDMRLGRRVAVKILKPELARDPSFLARFRREAQSAASLNHPNVVAVYDTGEDVLGESASAVIVPFIVMELVEGITLRELLRSENKLVPERALEITSEILAALDYSHRHGIIHRDIKPGNVMLTGSGMVKVMDFGIARATSDTQQTATSASTIMGTAAYLSPEQAQGRTVDARSDLYSTGVVLFELLTRRPVFIADAPVAVAFAHVNETPPAPSSVDPTLPRSLDALVAKALAKDPAQRYQTAVEFRADVERAIAGVPVTRTSAPATPDSAETAVLGGVDQEATAALRPAVPTGPLPPVIPGMGGAGGPAAVPVAAPEPPRKPKRGAGRVLSATLLVIGLLAAGIWIVYSQTSASIAVPTLTGMTVDEARARLEAEGLKLGDETYRSSDSPENTITAQSPTAGERLREGGSVDVEVSAGKEQVQVPDLIDFRSIDDVRTALTEAGLTLGKVIEEDSEEPEETVLKQDPGANEMADAGSAVSIWVSNAKVTVPDVVGRTDSQARTELFNKGFEVDYAAPVESDAKAGTVVAQSPEGGTSAKKGALVTLTLAKEASATPEPTQTESPTVSASGGESAVAATTPTAQADGGGADGVGGGGAAGSPVDDTTQGENPGLSAAPQS